MLLKKFKIKDEIWHLPKKERKVLKKLYLSFTLKSTHIFPPKTGEFLLFGCRCTFFLLKVIKIILVSLNYREIILFLLSKSDSFRVVLNQTKLNLS